MANYPPPYPPPGPPYGNDSKYQRRIMKEQARMQRDVLRAQQQAYRQQLRGMRRGSIVGPMLVIALGVVFLLVQTGQLESHRLWDWYSRFWPLLLVGAGAIMLLEWAFDQHIQSDPTGPRYRRSIGGGVFTLLLLLGLTGLIFSGIRQGGSSKLFPGLNFNQDNLDEFMGDKHESDQTLSQDFPVGTTLSVDNPRGDISVSGTSDDNQIHVSVHKQVFTRSDSEADNKTQQLSPNLTKEGTTLNIKLPSVEGGRADLVITVPAAAATSLSANHGDIRVSELKAPANVTANHGDVTLSGITGRVGAHINNGDASFSAHSITGQIDVEGKGRDLTLTDISGPVNLDGEFFGTTHIERVQGATRFHTSRTDFRLGRLDGEVEISPNADLSVDQGGSLSLTTRNRNITLDRIVGDISVTNRNGSVDLTAAPPLGNITIENRNGSVNVTVPEQSGFTVQAETTNGDVENDFSIPTQDNDPRKNFGGTVGQGSSLIRITTSQGDIALRKASVAPLPPAPPPPPPLSIRGSDGSHVIIGKNGINISSGPDGSSVIVDKDGARISTRTDGAHTYTESNGTTLTTSVDGTKTYATHQGDSYTSTPDGTKTYSGHDGTRITVSPDGTKVGIGPGGKPLSNAEIDSQLRRVEAEIRRLIDQHKNNH
jgi:DUF4097 and DUF4098 domain-containing protein YvlB